jgi:hypothetical protein
MAKGPGWAKGKSWGLTTSRSTDFFGTIDRTLAALRQKAISGHASFYTRSVRCGAEGRPMADFATVKQFLLDLQLSIVKEDAAECIVVVEDEERGLKNLVIDCEDPIVIFEQVILLVPTNPGDLFRRLLQMNRELVHGAFVLNEEGTMVLFRDTLQLSNLDLNEVEGTIEALSLALAEHAAELIAFSRQ